MTPESYIKTQTNDFFFQNDVLYVDICLKKVFSHSLLSSVLLWLKGVTAYAMLLRSSFRSPIKIYVYNTVTFTFSESFG